MVQKIKNILTKGEFSKRFAVGIMVVFALIVFTMICLVAFVNENLGGTFVAMLGILVTIPVSVIGFYFSSKTKENILKIGKDTSSLDNIILPSTDSQG